jgi:5-hydroxyisourate hydrolase
LLLWCRHFGRPARLTAAAVAGNGRGWPCRSCAVGRPLHSGVHRLRFETDAYFSARGMAGFYPEVTVVFEVADPSEHHHVPLLRSPYGYTSYRGS